MKSTPGLHLPNNFDTLLLQAAIHPDERGLAAWRQLRPYFSVDEAHWGQVNLLPLVHRTLCSTNTSDPDRDRLAGQRRLLWTQWTLMNEPLTAALQRLKAAAIPIMLGGEAARAHRLDGNDHSLRQLKEIHLLIHPADRQRATTLIEDSDPIRLLNRASDRWAAANTERDPFWEQAEETTLAGISLFQPSATDLLLYILVEGTRFAHRGHIRWAADAAQLISEQDINWRRLGEQASIRRVAATTAIALNYLSSALHVFLPPEAPTGTPEIAETKLKREQLINRLWNNAPQGPSRRNAAALVLAQSAGQPLLASFQELGRRATKTGGANLASELHHGLQVLKRLRRPESLLTTTPDLPTPKCFRGTVIVASTPRSGSTLLCSALERTGLAGIPREYLMPQFLASGHQTLGTPRPTRKELWRRTKRLIRLERNWWGYWEVEPSSMGAYIRHLVAHRSTANGIFALKIHWHHFEKALQMGFCLSQLPQPITWIHLTRQDRIAQAVSFAKAEQSGAYSSKQESPHTTRHLRFNDTQILRCHKQLHGDAFQWKQYFRAHHIESVPVDYEDLSSDYESTVTRILLALGLEDTPVPPPGLKRQADAMNRTWIETFRRNHPELTGPNRNVAEGPRLS